tara:strand:+ start:3279 stop:3746 length:468 start_codon:yes stop_codon:yes gene_type:complete
MANDIRPVHELKTTEEVVAWMGTVMTTLLIPAAKTVTEELQPAARIAKYNWSKMPLDRINGVIDTVDRLVIEVEKGRVNNEKIKDELVLRIQTVEVNSRNNTIFQVGKKRFSSVKLSLISLCVSLLCILCQMLNVNLKYLLIMLYGILRVRINLN